MHKTELETKLPSSAKRVQEYLSRHGFTCNVIELAQSTRTAQEAAEAIGCQVGQIAKSLIFKNKIDGTPILIVASGENRVDVKKIEQQTGLRLGRADGNYVKEAVGFAIGGIPPVAHITKLLTILDPDLRKHDRIWAAAGTPQALFELNPEDLLSMTDGRWVELAESR